MATHRAGQGQERGALGAGGQGRAEGRADGMRGGGRRGSVEVGEGEEVGQEEGRRGADRCRCA